MSALSELAAQAAKAARGEPAPIDPPDTASLAGLPAAPGPGLDVAPEQIGLWGLLGILYPLMLLVGIRLLRIGSRRSRAWARRRLDDWQVWLRGSSIPEGRVRALRRSADLGVRLIELALYLLCIYGFSLYFFLLIPGTRELGIDMAGQFWPPLRAAILLLLRTFTHLAFAVLVFLLARWGIPRLRTRLGTEVAHPASSQERERLLLLKSVAGLVWFLAAILVILVLPGPGRMIGVLLLALAVLILLIATRRTLENVAAGFSVGRAAGVNRGSHIACRGCEGVLEEWTLTGWRVRTADGKVVHLPYRLCEGAPLTVDEPDATAGS